jgi:hypothetical protein
MKAISLWQPYASLIQAGAKRWETRSWNTHYRGPLVICSTKTGYSKRELNKLLLREVFQKALSPLIDEDRAVKIDDLPTGQALSLVQLTNVIPTERLSLSAYKGERVFGDFAPGRYAWQLEDIEPLQPFPVTGKQGFFELDNQKVAKAREKEFPFADA